MTIARIPDKHPASSILDTGTAMDNGAPCSSVQVRALEDSVVYIATRGNVGMGGMCRPAVLTATANSFMRVPVATYTDHVAMRIGVTSSAAGNTVDFGGDATSIAKSADHTNQAEVQHMVERVTTAVDPVTITCTVTVNSGTVIVWYLKPDPVQLTPGNVTVR